MFFAPKGVPLPTAVSVFPGRDLCRPGVLGRARLPQPDLLQQADKGGHFAAWEQPATVHAGDAGGVSIAALNGAAWNAGTAMVGAFHIRAGNVTRSATSTNSPSEGDMNADANEPLVAREGCRPASAEQRLKELGIELPAPPEPFGVYAEAVQTGNLLFLSGMLPTEGREAKFIGRVGAELDVEAGRKAARLAALNALAVARQHLGSLDRVTRIVRLGVSVATSGDVRDQPKVADAASELLQDVFGKRQEPLPPGVWRRQPSARHPGRTGSHFRGGGVARCSQPIGTGRRKVPWHTRRSIARYRSMGSPSFTGRPARKTRRRCSCCTDCPLHRGCSSRSSPGLPIAITWSRPTIRASDTATGRTRKRSRTRSITSPRS